MIGKLGKVMSYTVATLCTAVALMLIAFGLPFTGWKALSVQTGSMRPHIDPGALVLVHRVPDSSLRIGDVITYNSMLNPGERITHRIVGFKQVGPVRDIVVRGDANKLPDPPLMPSQVVGRVATSVPYAGRAIDFLHSIPGLILFVYLPALLLIVYEIKLLVTRLTELELEKRKQEASRLSRLLGHAPAITPTPVARPNLMPGTIIHASQNQPANRSAPLRHGVRSIDGMRI